MYVLIYPSVSSEAFSSNCKLKTKLEKLKTFQFNFLRFEIIRQRVKLVSKNLKIECTSKNVTCNIRHRPNNKHNKLLFGPDSKQLDKIRDFSSNQVLHEKTNQSLLNQSFNKSR